MIATSASGHVWLLLDDVDDGIDPERAYTAPFSHARSSTWLNLETGVVRRFDLCRRVLFEMGWQEMPELQEKAGTCAK